MGQYIDKSALVAEIEKIKSGLFPNFYEYNYDEAKVELLEKIEEFLNTIEVKEVDLKKEFDNYTKDISACDVQFEPFTQLYNCAKHFYELGLKSKG